MKIPYKGGGIALFQKNSETGLSLDDIVVDDTIIEGSNKPVICNTVIPFIFRWRTLIFILKDDWKYDNRRFHEFSEVKQIPLSELSNYELAFGIKQEVRKFKKKYL